MFIQMRHDIRTHYIICSRSYAGQGSWAIIANKGPLKCGCVPLPEWTGIDIITGMDNAVALGALNSILDA